MAPQTASPSGGGLVLVGPVVGLHGQGQCSCQVILHELELEPLQRLSGGPFLALVTLVSSRGLLVFGLLS